KPVLPDTVLPAKDSPMPEYLASWLGLGSPAEVTLDHNPEHEVDVAVTMGGAFTGGGSVSLSCEPTDDTLAQWRTAAYGQLLGAYEDWERQYQDDLRAATVTASQQRDDQSSPERNQEIIREELKRQVIEFLFGDTFAGLPARAADSPDGVPRT